jgi:adenylosuccinate lyase
LALVEKGMAREAAYRIVQAAALRAWDEGGDFRQELEAAPDVTERLSTAEIEDLFDPTWHVRNSHVTFKRVGIGEEK